VSGRVRLHRWDGPGGLAHGLHDGTAVRDGALVLVSASSHRAFHDPHRDRPPVCYERATWISPVVDPGFAVTEIVPSWNACTPPGCWIEVAVRGTTAAGVGTHWYVLGRWAETDDEICPATVPGQADEHATTDVDRLRVTPGRPWSTYQVRVSLLRRTGSTVTPSVSLVTAVASHLDRSDKVGRSASGGAEGIVLDVPPYSQQVHRGEYPQWGNGGESWCSPTSTTMVLAHWGLGPAPKEYAWVDESLRDREVDYAARYTYDHHYGIPGNWPFNTAYAARFGATAFVTRMRSLTEVEQFVKAGIPLVLSVSFTEEQLGGAGYSTEGHLLTVVGFDADGNVVCNDPASHGIPSNDEVRTTYDREQFEQAWLGRTFGIVYVIHPPSLPLPPPPSTDPNW
jgi:hypothetical protein